MPREIATKEEFTALMERAVGVRVVRSGDSAKVKLKTKDALYTFKTTSDEADSLVKGAKVPVVEFGQKKK